jgi:hypothetical protein
LRATGSSYQLRPDGTVSNLYTLELLNKSGREIDFEIAPADSKMQIQLVNKITRLGRDGSAKLSFFLIGDRKDIETYKTKIKVNILSEGKIVETMKTTFIAPPGE